MYLNSTSIVLILSVCSTTFGQTAGMLSFEGRLSQSGVPIEGAVNLKFEVFDAVAMGQSMAGPYCVQNVQVTSGLISTKFGPVLPSAFDGGDRWLEVSICQDVLCTNCSTLPRLEMATAPATAEQINIPGTGNPAVSVGASGNIGIGVPPGPGALKLNVADKVWVETALSGEISLWNSSKSSRVAQLRGGVSEAGRLDVNRTDGGFGVIVNADDGTAIPEIQIGGGNETTTVHIRGQNDAHTGGQLILFKAGGIQGANPRCKLTAEPAGHLELRNDANDTTLSLMADSGSGGSKVSLYSELMPLQETITLDGNTGRIGIGTPSPEAKLQISGTPGIDGIKFPDGTVQTTACCGASSQPATYVHNLISSHSVGGAIGADFFVDIGDSVQTLTIPPGIAVLTWSLSCSTGTSGAGAMFRPSIGGITPTTPTHYRFPSWTVGNTGNFTISGSFATNVPGGLVDVKLQARIDGGQYNISWNSNDHLSWTLVVYPN